MNTANATASAVSTPRCTQRTPAPDADPATTASTTIPRMSSKTAAARMIFAVRVESTFMSESTRAVMPTLVATMAAATKVASIVVSPRTFRYAKPRTNGAITPATETRSALRLT